MICDPSAEEHTVSGLITDTTYYMTVRAVDGQDHPSYVADEIEITPRLVPTAPQSVTATPLISSIRIDWAPNEEIDLSGYRVYWRTDENMVYDSLTTDLLVDTTLTHSDLSGAPDYYYAIRAFDQDGNPGEYSEEAFGRPITLDQGLLLVDETRDQAMLPDSVQDEFYRYVLSNFSFDEHDYSSANSRPWLAHFGPYSTVIWHTDDTAEFLAPDVVSDLETYLEAGGKLWIVGWRPVSNFSGNMTYPFELDAADFSHRFLKVAAVDITAGTDGMESAVGIGGFPSIAVDPSKITIPSWQGRLKYVESLTPAVDAEVTHTMSLADETSPYHGTPCGICYRGTDFQAALFTFPLYYMQTEEARVLARYVLEEFGELDGEPNCDSIVQQQLRLLPIEPNPFTNLTTIPYELPASGATRIAIYDMSGRLMKTLHHGELPSGMGSLTWNGKTEQAHQAAAGVYLCILRQSDAVASRPVTLLR
jgi:hypothetical protein